MVNLKGYISSNFTKSFLMIFLPFFTIISLIYLVKIATLTSQIQITFFEILKLYSYSVSDIIFYTIPLSFITALANTLIRLSQDNELIALYALGVKSSTILRSFILLGVLFSILLLAISFLAMPLSKQYYKSFKNEKKAEAKLNISAREVGQKFGNYYIYVAKKDKNTLKNIVIYNRTDKKNEQFFSAKSGKIDHKQEVTSLLLKNGYGYTYSNQKLQQAKYKSIEVFDHIQNRNFKFEDIIIYWNKFQTSIHIMHRLLFFIFVSLIPLLSIYLVASFSMINPRYQSNHSFIVIFLTTLFLYLTASSLEKWGNLYILGASIASILILGYWLFRKRVIRYF